MLMPGSNFSSSASHSEWVSSSSPDLGCESEATVPFAGVGAALGGLFPVADDGRKLVDLGERNELAPAAPAPATKPAAAAAASHPASNPEPPRLGGGVWRGGGSLLLLLAVEGLCALRRR